MEMAPFYRFNSLMDFGDPLWSIDSVRKEVLKWGANNNSCFGTDLVGNVKLWIFDFNLWLIQVPAGEFGEKVLGLGPIHIINTPAYDRDQEAVENDAILLRVKDLAYSTSTWKG